MLSAGLAFSVLGNLHSVADCNCCFAPCASHDLRIWNLKTENVQIWQFGTVCCYFVWGCRGVFTVDLPAPQRWLGLQRW